MTSAVAQSAQHLSVGDYLQAAKKLVTSPVRSWGYFTEGSKLSKEYYAPGSQGAETAAMMDSLMKAGGGAAMDTFYGGAHFAALPKPGPPRSGGHGGPRPTAHGAGRPRRPPQRT